jgi:hypothetical protein
MDASRRIIPGDNEYPTNLEQNFTKIKLREGQQEEI